jgi:hypothetical protein
MPVKKLLVGTSKAKEVYVGTSKVKLIYLGTKCVFASPRTITISKGTGLNSVTVKVTEKDGSTHSTTVTSSSQAIEVGYGASVTFTTAAATYYTASSSNVSSATVTDNTTYTFSGTKVPSCTVYVRTRYNSSTSNADKVGTISGSYVDYSTLTTKTFSGQYSTTLTVPQTSTVSFTGYSAVVGFKAPSTKSTSITTSGTYVYADFTATTNTTTFTINNGTATTNTISKNAFTVTASLSVNLGTASSGATLATVPANYRPASNRTYTNGAKWCTAASYVNAAPNYVTPTITVATGGAVSANKQSYGQITHASGGKWGGGSTTSQTVLSLSNITWSVV